MQGRPRHAERAHKPSRKLPEGPFEFVYLNVIGEGAGALQADLPRLVQHLKHFAVDDYSVIQRSANYREVGGVHFYIYMPEVGHTFNATTNKPELIELLTRALRANRQKYEVTPRTPDYESAAA